MTRLISAIAIIALGAQLLAQELPNPQPGEAHRILAADVGTWDADIKMYLQGPDGPVSEFKGVETNELVSGGLAIRSAFKSQMDDRDFEGHGLSGYDPRSQEYVAMWVDNLSAVPVEIRGKYDAEKKTLTMFSTAIDPSGQELKQKQITTYVDETTKKFELFLVLDIGGQMQDFKLMDMTLKKR